MHQFSQISTAHQLINSKPYYQITDAPIKLFLYIDLLLSLGTEHIAPNES